MPPRLVGGPQTDPSPGPVPAMFGSSRGRMMITKLQAFMIGLCLLGGATAAHAQAWPTRPVTIFVTAAAGGVTDVVARAVGAKLSEMWGQPVVIENKGGAAHIIGAQQVAKAAPDGHTLLAAESGTFVLNPSFYTPDRLGYVVGKDIIP